MIARKRSLQRKAVLCAAALIPIAANAQTFQQFDLVSNVASPATITDPNLVNPWGISMSATSPFWVSDNGTGVSTLYNVNPVTDSPSKVGLTVTIPNAGNVTGQT